MTAASESRQIRTGTSSGTLSKALLTPLTSPSKTVAGDIPREENRPPPSGFLNRGLPLLSSPFPLHLHLLTPPSPRDLLPFLREPRPLTLPAFLASSSLSSLPPKSPVQSSANSDGASTSRTIALACAPSRTLLSSKLAAVLAPSPSSTPSGLSTRSHSPTSPPPSPSLCTPAASSVVKRGIPSALPYLSFRSPS
ncbi:hypothetical protein BDZ91DRAFT_749931 [Kalaharituber pfeilii]|nr:hypothetical protein BDZ91DRAFT_749931 [Kalaharituber pfeilii]